MTNGRVILWALVVISVLAVPSGLEASVITVTFDASLGDRGFYPSTGQHIATNDATITGGIWNVPNQQLIDENAFLIWDVSSLDGYRVTDMTLRVGSDLAQGDLPKTVDVYDVSTSAGDLKLTYPINSVTGQAIWADLQTGNRYGSFEVDAPPNTHTLVLNAQAIADLNAALALGEFDFAIGLDFDPGDVTANSLVRFNQEPRVLQLEVTAVPEPITSTALLLLLGTGLMAGVKGRRPQKL